MFLCALSSNTANISMTSILCNMNNSYRATIVQLYPFLIKELLNYRWDIFLTNCLKLSVAEEVSK
ncbi:hypothetical protein Lwal_3036 [Legionella waltersii]|uniref:Uncharacterized protein n=1 Tax=Legionella waltersii TaxID=66969 RepID=A0A0W1A1V1_9GAMM|nr:hypothetical protein Lwal_3036 [Legionella waltersii]SNV05638.1 Uncharacterised protein [Legionella waltersii]